MQKILKHFGVKGVISVILEKINPTRETIVVTDFHLRSAGFPPQILEVKKLEGFLRLSPEQISLIDKEFRELEVYLKDASMAPREQFFESVFDLGWSMSHFLYLACRTYRPGLVVETGVAAGMSSTVILSALVKNSQGNLVSFDISRQVGELIPGSLRSRWSLKVLPLRRQESMFQKYISECSDAQIFLHDSDHSDYWQIFEFVNAYSVLKNCNLFLFDDVSLALLEHVRSNYPGVKITVVSEGHKFSAIFLRG